MRQHHSLRRTDRWSFVLHALVLSTALLLVGCDTGASSSDLTGTPVATPNAPAEVGGGPPAASGPYVIRYEGTSFLYVRDPRSGTAGLYGVDVFDFCNGEPGFLDIVPIMRVNVPEGANRVVQLIHGDDVATSVWNPALPLDPSSEAFCTAVLAGTGLIASGTSDLTATDNDLLAYLDPDRRHANAWGFSAHGMLEAPGGETAVINAHHRCMWLGNGLDTSRCHSMINVH